MPSSWQEFQFLQQSVAKYAQGTDALPVPAADLAYAQDFGEKLDEIYPVFKNVISEVPRTLTRTRTRTLTPTPGASPDRGRGPAAAEWRVGDRWLRCAALRSERG